MVDSSANKNEVSGAWKGMSKDDNYRLKSGDKLVGVESELEINYTISGEAWANDASGQMNILNNKSNNIKIQKGKNKIRLAIPRKWFKDGEKSIKLQARIGQKAEGVSGEVFGSLMSNSLTAYLVADTGPVTFANSGPKQNGIRVVSRDEEDGTQQIGVSGEVQPLNASPTVTWKFPQKDATSKTGIIAVTSNTSGTFTGVQNLSYDTILKGVQAEKNDAWKGGDLTIVATIDDPNNTINYTIADVSVVQTYTATSVVTLYPFKTPTGTMEAAIARNTVGKPPLCSCDFNKLQLNGWTLSSLSLDVFETDNSGVKVVNQLAVEPNVAKEPTDFNAFNPGLTLKYKDSPGRYDCKYTAKFTLNMPSDAYDMYPVNLRTQPQPLVKGAYEATAVCAANRTNFYNDPEITGISLVDVADLSGAAEDLSGVVMRVQGMTNGSQVPISGYQSLGFVRDGSDSDVEVSFVKGDDNAGKVLYLYRLDVSGNLVSANSSLNELNKLGNGQVDNDKRWEFDIMIKHDNSLVADPFTHNGNLNNGNLNNNNNKEYEFDGLAIINPSDALSVTGLLF